MREVEVSLFPMKTSYTVMVHPHLDSCHVRSPFPNSKQRWRVTVWVFELVEIFLKLIQTFFFGWLHLAMDYVLYDGVVLAIAGNVTQWMRVISVWANQILRLALNHHNFVYWVFRSSRHFKRRRKPSHDNFFFRITANHLWSDFVPLIFSSNRR